MLTKSNVSGFSLIPVLFVLTLFLLLSALSISVIIAGSTVYEKISDNMDNNYDRRVTFSYLATKIRQNDSGGSIYIEEKNGVRMMAIKEKYDSWEYVTYIYYYDPTPEDTENDDGYIREIFLEVESDGSTINFNLEDGDPIIRSKGFKFDLNGSGIIKMSLADENGNVQATKIVLRSQG